MRALVLAVLMLADVVRGDPRPSPPTARRALATAPELVDVQTTAAFRAVARQLTHDVGLTTTIASPVSITTAAFGAIDATVGSLGPIFLTNARTLGTAGALNVNALAQHATLDQYDGARTLEARKPLVTRNPQTGALTGMRLNYRLTYRVDAIALAATYGLRDDLDVSLVVPFSAVGLDIHAASQVVRAAQGERFVPLRGTPTLTGETTVDGLGLGDVTLRLKWQLPVGGLAERLYRQAGDTYALNVTAAFPTGSVPKARGAGHYLLNLGTAAVFPWTVRGVRGELAANAAINFDLGDATETQLLYGIGVSAELLRRPMNLIGSVEFLGRTQLDATALREETGVLVVQTPTQLAQAPALGLDFGRKDYVDLAVGLRVPLSTHLAAFAAGVIALNDAGLRTSSVAPTIGVGGTW